MDISVETPIKKHHKEYAFVNSGHSYKTCGNPKALSATTIPRKHVYKVVLGAVMLHPECPFGAPYSKVVWGQECYTMNAHLEPPTIK